jgi:PAS domain S-box-containing protein
MPRLNGLEMIEKIKIIKEDIPVFVFSAHNEPKFFIESIKLNVDGYLLKPLDINYFTEVLYKVTQKIELLERVKENAYLLEQYKKITDESAIISKTNLKGIITYANDKFCEISEYSREELIGHNHNIIRNPDTSPAVFENMWDTIKNKKQTFKALIKNRSKSGKIYYVNSTVKPILDTQGNILEYIALNIDLTQLIGLKNKIEKEHAYRIGQEQIAKEKLEAGIVNQLSEEECQILYLPCDTLSGDFYSTYKLCDGSIFAYIIDGQGHGTSPALTVFSVSSTINNLVNNNIKFEDIIEQLFLHVKNFLDEIEQLSYIMIKISADKSNISYCSGGMYPAFINTDDKILRLKTNNTPFMNFSPTPTIKNKKVENWKSLILYSDGIVEHNNSELDNYLPKLLIKEPLNMQNAIKFLSKHTFEDDVTLLNINNI